MLHLFGPGCPATPIDAQDAALSIDNAVWLDLLNPTHDEEQLAERVIGTNVPTREEMQEIEPSSRLYERDGVAFMTMAVLYGVNEGKPSTDPIRSAIASNSAVFRCATATPPCKRRRTTSDFDSLRAFASASICATSASGNRTVRVFIPTSV